MLNCNRKIYSDTTLGIVASQKYFHKVLSSGQDFILSPINLSQFSGDINVSKLPVKKEQPPCLYELDILVNQ